MGVDHDGTPLREFSHGRMMHRLPKADLVDRVAYLCEHAAGRRVIHVGFVDSGCRTMQEQAGAWLHGHLLPVASSLVGIDVDETGVQAATDAGYEAYAADCRDADALAALELKPADLVIAGEIIEHLDDPGAFLAGLHTLVAPGGELIVSTPNAYGLFNVFASLARREINHPDHVLMFTWRTLTNLAARHGWEPVATAVYVPTVKDLTGADLSATVLGLCAGVAVGIERGMTRLGRSFAADGMIVVFRSTRH